MARGRPEDLVERVRAIGVRDERVLGALRAVPRAAFVPRDSAALAYADIPVPIARDQVTTQPSLTARMVATLELAGDERVLEVGTGLGFQTALLARLAAWVWSVERWPELAHCARENLAGQGVDNVEVLVGDGTEGHPAAAPYDAIVISAAFPEVPAPLVEQLAPRGRLVQPIGPGGREDVVLFERRGTGLKRRRRVAGAHFVRLYGRHGYS